MDNELKPNPNRGQALLDALARQRNDALDKLAMAEAELQLERAGRAGAEQAVVKLTDELRKLKGEPGDKQGGT